MTREQALAKRRLLQKKILQMVDAGALDHVIGAKMQAVEEQKEADIFAGDDFEAADFVAQEYQRADSLTRKAALRHQHWSQLAEVAPFARNNPPSILKGTLGGQQPVSNDQLIQVAKWAGDDAETIPISVTIAPVQFLGDTPAVSQFKSSDPFRPFAVVQFGTRGMSVKAEVDIGQGCQFTISASSIDLQVGMDSDPSNSPPGTFQMKLAGMLSFHTIVRTQQITRTIYRGAFAGGDAANPNITIPPFAKSVTVWRQGSTVTAATAAPPMRVLFLGKRGGTLYSIDVAAASYMFDPLPISPDAVFMVIQNQSVGDTINSIHAIFNLAL
jgi:hypothetical protein